MCIISSQEAKINITKTKNRKSYSGANQGSLSIVGIGPGDIQHLSQKVKDAIGDCDLLVGYKTYINLLGSLASRKEIFSSGMTQEIERAKCAINQAHQGKKVCVVSSGDPGIYGMAGLVLELLDSKDSKNIKVEIIPGIPALNSCASLLGAPLMHDFAVISLSDLLTERKLIEKRIKLACQGDFVIVFYNPKSKKRVELFNLAWQILMKNKPAQTPVGIVRNAYRDEQKVTITTLDKMLKIGSIDMLTTIIIGNSQTYIKNKYMITPRGYEIPKRKKA